MKLYQFFLVTSVVVLVGGCVGGQVIEGSNSGPLNQSFDGSYMDYFLPRGEFVAKASYDPQTEIITITSDTKILPDLKRKEHVLYRHSDMSNDVVTIELESNGLLKSVSTTTTDQAKEVVKAVAEVAQQFSTLRGALAKPAAGEIDNKLRDDKTTAPAAHAPPPPPDCSKMSVAAVFDLTYGSEGRNHKTTNSITTKATPAKNDPKKDDPDHPQESCTLAIRIAEAPAKEAAISQVSLDAAAYPATAFQYDEQPKICPVNAVCFRTATGHELKITATLLRPRTEPPLAETTETVVGPSPNNQGVLYFNRRAFVSNSTSATFNNGMLTKLTATDPSAALGALQLSTEILKSLTVLVKL